ncbi:PAS domain S-box protein [Planctomycetota bacterium]
MELPNKLRRHVFFLICLIGLIYVGITFANNVQVVSDKVADSIKLGLMVILCGVGFLSGFDYFRFTRTTPVFLSAMCFLILFHIIELTEEFTVFQTVPLFGQTTLAKHAFETVLMIGSICFLLGGNYLSVSAINTARKQLELNVQDLREREERYRILFEGANDAIFIMESDQFFDCNSKTLAIYGCTREQIIGKTPSHFSPSTQPDGIDSTIKARKKIEATMAGTPQSFEWKHQRLDGTPFDAEVSLNLVDWPTGMHIQAIVRDITERKRAEEKLAESEEKYRQLTERINEWVWEVDRQGIYTYASPRVEALLGYQPVEVVGKTPFDFMPSNEAVQVKEKFSRYFQQKQAFEGLENTNIKKNGERVVLETSGSPKFDEKGELVGYFGLDRDITERKQAEQAREESEGRLRQLIDAAPYGAHEYELQADDRLIFVGYNRVANRILKTDCNQFLGKTIEQAFPPLEQTPIPTAYRKVAVTGESYEDEQVNYVDDWISGAFEISAFQTGPGRMAVLFRDITERRRAEEKVAQYQNQLRALVSQLTLSEERERKNLAVELHDSICQSLAMVKLKVDEELSNHSVAVVQTLLQDLQQSLLGIMHEARTLTNNLGTPMLQQLGLSAALEEWMNAEITAKHGIKTEVVDKGVPKTMSENTKSLLFRAVRELAINVVKHAQAHTLTLTLEVKSGELSMVIIDDGKGFEYTESLKQDFRHHGYGLFSINERITYIGGSMTVNSVRDKGTRILLYVPLESKEKTIIS